MPLPATLPTPPPTIASTTSASTNTSTTTSSHPSLVHRLLDSVPEHAAHLFERLFAPNTIQYTPPHNDPHNGSPSPTQSPTKDSAPSSPKQESAPRIEARRRRWSYGSKGKEATGREVNIVEVNGYHLVGEETDRPSEDYGVPLCREAEIEKWKTEGARRRIRRRKTIY